MGATAIEFRLRVVIMAVIITLGFWSPWLAARGLGSRISLLEWLALEISRTGLLHFSAAIPVVIVLAALVAAAAAVLRIWGTAYLGTATVNHAQMQAGAVVAGGPYRYVRNPLYLGTWCMVAAMAFLMPLSGAVFTLVLVSLLLLRLILGEEAHLARHAGQTYSAYRAAVPRLIPLLRSTLPSSGQKPQWLHALFAEVNPIGIFFTLAVLSWSYNGDLLVKAIVVSFGISLVVRAFLPAPGGAEPA